MAGNSNLHDSAKNKQDEFYTQLSLIESELKHYKAFSKEKLCFATVMTLMKVTFLSILQ